MPCKFSSTFRDAVHELLATETSLNCRGITAFARFFQKPLTESKKVAIDPVILLVSELRESEKSLIGECKLQSARYCPDRADRVASILQRVRALYGELIETAPTSAIGSSELIRIAGQRLPFSHSRYAWHLEEIADRLAEGERLHSDLIWVRALADALAAGTPDRELCRTVTLLQMAIRGAAMPVLVHRGIQGRGIVKPAGEKLAPQLFIPAPFGPAGGATRPKGS